MNGQNLQFQTAELASYFSNHRDTWSDFYPSERWVIERVAKESGGLGHVLDVGCATGGLGQALAQRGLLTSYTGIDVNRHAIDAAQNARQEGSVPFRFECGDILQPPRGLGTVFDTVFSLSCADWNIETRRILDACWDRVAHGGRFIVSLRLTDGPGINDIRRSYQPIVSNGRPGTGGERANYVVFNIDEALGIFAGFSQPASRLLGYGYWGKPSKTAVTPYQRLVFAVFAAWKGEVAEEPAMQLRLPLSLWAHSQFPTSRSA